MTRTRIALAVCVAAAGLAGLCLTRGSEAKQQTTAEAARRAGRGRS